MDSPIVSRNGLTASASGSASHTGTVSLGGAGRWGRPLTLGSWLWSCYPCAGGPGRLVVLLVPLGCLDEAGENCSSTPSPSPHDPRGLAAGERRPEGSPFGNLVSLARHVPWMLGTRAARNKVWGITRPRPTKRQCASGTSGSSRCLPRRRSGTGGGGSDCEVSSTRTSKDYLSRPGRT